MSWTRARSMLQASRTVALVLVLAGLALALGEPFSGVLRDPAGTTSGTGQAGAARTRDTLVVALARAPASLDPADHRSRESETVIRNMYDGLVTRDTRIGVHPEIAESVQWLDPTTLEVRIRRGVRFHDGTPLTAEDVVFTFERTIGENALEYPRPHTSPRKGLIEPLTSIEQRDSHTVVMHFRGPWPSGLQQLVQHQVVSRAYVAKHGSRGLAERPLGTGPFRFVSASPGLGEVVMARFDGYYGGAPDLPPVGRACVPRVVFRTIPEASKRVTALLAGDVDIIAEVPAELMAPLEQTPGVQVRTAPGTRPLWMEMNVRRFPFGDQRVRQALNYAVDKDLLVRQVYHGLARPLAGPLSPLNSFANPRLKPYPHDKQVALALLEEAGWSRGADGTLRRDGEPFEFVIDVIDSARPLALALAAQLADIGVRASVQVWEYNELTSHLLAGERQAYLGDWGDAAFDPVGHLEAKWSTYRSGSPYGRANYSNYSNLRVDTLIRYGEVEPDEARRHALYDEAQALINDEAPAVFLLLPESVEAASTRVRGWEPAADGRENLHDVCLTP